MLFLRYPFSFVVVSVAFVVTAGIFLFLRPQYHDPTPGTTVDLSGYPQAAHGWTWKDGTPGFLVRTGREDWNVSRVRPSELPRGARLLNSQRSYDGLSTLVARGHCIGATLPHSLRWFCPPRLAGKEAFVVVDAVDEFGNGDGYPFNIVGVTRADVTRVVLRNAQLTTYVGRDNSVTKRYAISRTSMPIHGNWGTFAISSTDAYRPHAVPSRPWRMRLDFYGAHGLLASEQLAFRRPGTQLVVVR